MRAHAQTLLAVSATPVFVCLWPLACAEPAEPPKTDLYASSLLHTDVALAWVPKLMQDSFGSMGSTWCYACSALTCRPSSHCRLAQRPCAFCAQ